MNKLLIVLILFCGCRAIKKDRYSHSKDSTSVEVAKVSENLILKDTTFKSVDSVSVNFSTDTSTTKVITEITTDEKVFKDSTIRKIKTKIISIESKKKTQNKSDLKHDVEISSASISKVKNVELSKVNNVKTKESSLSVNKKGNSFTWYLIIIFVILLIVVWAQGKIRF